MNPSSRKEIVSGMDLGRRYGSFLKWQRRTRFISRKRLAKNIGIDESVLMDWESGRATPPARKFYAIVCYLGRRAHRKAALLDQTIQFEVLEATGIVEARPPTISEVVNDAVHAMGRAIFLEKYTFGLGLVLLNSLIWFIHGWEWATFAFATTVYALLFFFEHAWWYIPGKRYNLLGRHSQCLGYEMGEFEAQDSAPAHARAM